MSVSSLNLKRARNASVDSANTPSSVDSSGSIPAGMTPFIRAKMKARLQAAQDRLLSKERESDAALTALEEAKRVIAKLRSRIAVLEATLADMEGSQGKGDEKDGDMEKARAKIQALRSDLADAQQEAKAGAKRAGKAEKALASVTALHNSVISRLGASQQKAKALSLQMRETKRELQACREDQADVTAKLEEVERERDAALKSLEETKADARAAIQAAAGKDGAQIAALQQRFDDMLRSKDEVVASLHSLVDTASEKSRALALDLDKARAALSLEQLRAAQALIQARNLEAENARLRNPHESAPTGDVALVFTDVQGSTRMWNAMPSSMGAALWMHNAAIRAIIAETGGYEVKTEGDAFMIAYQSAGTAIEAALQIQERMMALDWSDEVLATSDGARQVGPNGEVIFSGFRVRIGVHVGPVVSRPDPVHGRMDFFGPTVNEAARIESAAIGGQTLVSSEVLKAVLDGSGNAQDVVSGDLGVPLPLPLLRPQAHAIPVGEYTLTGIEGRVPLFQISSDALSARVFDLHDEDEITSPKPEFTAAVEEQTLPVSKEEGRVLERILGLEEEVERAQRKVLEVQMKAVKTEEDARVRVEEVEEQMRVAVEGLTKEREEWVARAAEAVEATDAAVAEAVAEAAERSAERSAEWEKRLETQKREAEARITDLAKALEALRGQQDEARGEAKRQAGRAERAQEDAEKEVARVRALLSREREEWEATQVRSRQLHEDLLRMEAMHGEAVFAASQAKAQVARLELDAQAAQDAQDAQAAQATLAAQVARLELDAQAAQGREEALRHQLLLRTQELTASQTRHREEMVVVMKEEEGEGEERAEGEDEGMPSDHHGHIVRQVVEELQDRVFLLRKEKQWLLDELEIAQTRAGIPLTHPRATRRTLR